MSLEELRPVRGPTWWRRMRTAANPNLRHIQLIEPRPEDIHRLGEMLSLDRGLLKQLQDLSLSPGLVSYPDSLLARLNVPCIRDDEPLEWQRVDVLLGGTFIVTVSPMSVRVVPAARQRFEGRKGPRRGDTLLALIVSETVLTFQNAVSELVQRFDALGAADTETVSRMRVQLQDLRRGLVVLRDTLSEFQHPRRHRQVGPNARGEMVAHRDRLLQIDSEAERALERMNTVLEQLAGAEEGIDVESPQIIEHAATLGERRLHRITPAHAITALIGGMAVSFGAVAMAWTAGPWMERLGPERAQWLGALVFPIGFIILIVGKGELFTENFLVPVTSVWKGRGTLAHLFSLWTSTLVFNLVGGLIFAFLATRQGIFSENAAAFLVHLAEVKTSYRFWPTLLKGVFAGWLMTILTWLLLATRGTGPRLLIIWAIGFLIVAGHFNHVVISAVEIFMGMGLGAPITLGGWFFGNFIPALVGNLIGGIVFVTAASYIQAHSLRLSEQRQREALQPTAPRPPTVRATPTALPH